MRRSEIDRLIDEAISFLDGRGFKLPEWGYWTRQDWRAKGLPFKRFRELGLGWDVTDFGSGDFYARGLLLFTVRNGVLGSQEYAKDYAEKLMIARRDQLTPCHFHRHKMEDIINRGGGDFVVKLWRADERDGLSQEGFSVLVDEAEVACRPGQELTLKPGQSICLEPRVYHEFRTPAETLLLGEVSRVNDDASDNRFLEETARFSEIEEDVEAKYYLCNEYPD